MERTAFFPLVHGRRTGQQILQRGFDGSKGFLGHGGVGCLFEAVGAEGVFVKADQGIAAGDCVVSAEGYLVGIISEVGYNWSTVLTVIDTDTELGARIFRTGEVAVAEGDFALMGQSRLKLSYLTSDDEVLIGDQIVTSGLGGYYPSGLVIGAVESLKTGDDGLARYAVLAPMMDFNTLTEVFVITDFSIVD